MYKHLLSQRAVSRQEVTDNAHAVSHKTTTMINHAHPFITICLLLHAFIRKHTEHGNTYEDFCKTAVLPNTINVIYWTKLPEKSVYTAV
jgi:hypothetical protein